MLRAVKVEDDFVKFFCFSVALFWETLVSSDTSWFQVSGSELEFAAHTLEEMSRKGAL